MYCSRSVVLLNNALKIAVMKNGDLSLIQLGLDKEKREITESVIAIYQNELNLLSDVVNLLRLLVEVATLVLPLVFKAKK